MPERGLQQLAQEQLLACFMFVLRPLALSDCTGYTV